jgi:hypothetical protein
MSRRKTNYDYVPAQTHSYGRHDCKFPIAALFAEACEVAMARSIESLLSGTDVQGDPKAMVRRCEVTVSQAIKVRRIETCMPSLPELDFGQVEILAEAVADLQRDDGQWRVDYQDRMQSLVDKHVANLSLRYAELVSGLTITYGYLPANKLLMQLQRDLESVRTDHAKQVWDSGDTSLAADTADTLMRFHEMASGKSRWFKKYLTPFKADDKEELERLFEVAESLLEKRSNQLRAEAVVDVIDQLLDPSVAGMIPQLVRKIQAEAKRLKEIADALRQPQQLPKSTATTTVLVDSIRRKIDGERTLELAFAAAFEIAGKGRAEVLSAIRLGIPIGGCLVGPRELATMEPNTAKAELLKFGRDFFASAIPAALKIDMTKPELQLALAKRAVTLIQKSQPYLTFDKIPGAVEKYEFYLFCHPDLRTLIDKYTRGRIRFANAPDDKRFHVVSKHVVSLTSTVLGAGHARTDYYRGLYRRARMGGDFKTIYNHPEETAYPLAIAERACDEQDSRDLFALATSIGAVAEMVDGEESRFICSPLDHTIAPRFSSIVCVRRPISEKSLRRWVNQGWFKQCVRVGLPEVAHDWDQNMRIQMDQQTDHEIAERLCELKILERTAIGYQFGCPHSAGIQKHESLFELRNSEPQGLIAADFIRSMLDHDDLYTRVLFDVVMAEAAGVFEERQLPEFAQTMARKWRN